MSLRPFVAALVALVVLAGCQERQPASPAAETAVVRLETTLGPVTLELYPDRAPATVANFLSYVEEGFYAGTLFHRVIDGFMIQAGGYARDMKTKPTGPPVRNEADNGLSNQRGTLAMARTSDPHSAASQFFINTVDNPNLDHRDRSPAGWGYTVFGRVIEGMDVVDRIGRVATGHARLDGRPVPDVPTTPVVIRKATVVSR